jgi:hypothetical protein
MVGTALGQLTLVLQDSQSRQSPINATFAGLGKFAYPSLQNPGVVGGEKNMLPCITNPSTVIIPPNKLSC